jgi:hypothetical protein
MKLIINLPTPLLTAAKAEARQRGITLSELVTLGLLQLIENAVKPNPPFKLRKASFRGSGLQAEVQGASWEQLREMSYGDRGG